MADDPWPIVRMAELDIDPNQIERYRALLTEEIEASVRLEPGVLFLHAFALQGSPGAVRIVEGYRDRAAYEAHLTAPHFLRYKKETTGMVRSLRLIETDPIALRTKGDAGIG